MLFVQHRNLYHALIYFPDSFFHPIQIPQINIGERYTYVNTYFYLYRYFLLFKRIMTIFFVTPCRNPDIFWLSYNVYLMRSVCYFLNTYLDLSNFKILLSNVQIFRFFCLASLIKIESMIPIPLSKCLSSNESLPA